MLFMFTNLLRVAHRQGIIVICLLGVKIRPYFVHIQSDLWRTKSYLSHTVVNKSILLILAPGISLVCVCPIMSLQSPSPDHPSLSLKIAANLPAVHPCSELSEPTEVREAITTLNPQVIAFCF